MLQLIFEPEQHLAESMDPPVASAQEQTGQDWTCWKGPHLLEETPVPTVATSESIEESQREEMGSNEASQREEMRPSEASRHEFGAGEGRVDEITDYIRTFTSSPIKSVGDFQMQVSCSFIF